MTFSSVETALRADESKFSMPALIACSVLSFAMSSEEGRTTFSAGGSTCFRPPWLTVAEISAVKTSESRLLSVPLVVVILEGWLNNLFVEVAKRDRPDAAGSATKSCNESVV